MYGALADGVMVLHFGYLAYVALGGFVAWRWPRWIFAHVVAVAWGYSTILVGMPCPLTHLEDAFRQRAGEPGLGPGGFIDHYLEGVIYPEQYTPLVRTLVSAVVLLAWIGAVRRWRVALAGRRSSVESYRHASTER
jgi:hypothetical protein